MYKMYNNPLNYQLIVRKLYSAKDNVISGREDRIVSARLSILLFHQYGTSKRVMPSSLHTVRFSASRCAT